ncbi:MAG: hypothetical protein RXP86_08695 [Acidilobus sp.]|jgi:hypothetical protein
MSQDYEVIGATYDGRKIVGVTIQGATINANVPSLIMKSLLQLLVKGALNYMTQSPGTFNVTTVDNTVGFTLYAGTTTSISTIDVVLEAF